jgi:hypothetical protein
MYSVFSMYLFDKKKEKVLFIQQKDAINQIQQ